MFNVSSITVVRALNELANDGYIIRQQERGTLFHAQKHKRELYDISLSKDKVTVLSIEHWK